MAAAKKSDDSGKFDAQSDRAEAKADSFDEKSEKQPTDQEAAEANHEVRKIELADAVEKLKRIREAVLTDEDKRILADDEREAAS